LQKLYPLSTTKNYASSGSAIKMTLSRQPLRLLEDNLMSDQKYGPKFSGIFGFVSWVMCDARPINKYMMTK